MQSTIRGFIVFIIMVAVVAGALRLLNWVPEAVNEGTFRRFGTIEKAKEHLKISQVYLPAFYPSNVRWPPVLISGQGSPYVALITEFAENDRNGVFLVITQTARPHRPFRESITLTTIREEVRYPFKNRTALLEVGDCSDGDQCSRFSWTEGAFGLVLTMKASPRELVGMAESMVPRESQDRGQRN